jgi:nucleoid-associated protein YgaU
LVRRAELDPVVQRYAAAETAQARAKLDSAASHKAKVDDSASIQAGTPEMRHEIARNAYDQAMRDAADARTLAQEALRIGLEREREEYRRIASQKMEEARRMIEEVRKLKEQGLIKRSVPAPPPDEDADDAVDNDYDPDNYTDSNGSGPSPDAGPDTAGDFAGKSNIEKYEAALRALQLAEQNFESREYQDSIVHSEEAIRIARLILELIEAQRDLKFYVVRYLPRASDCLWRIASYPYIYGDARLWPKIWKANKHLIVDPDLIFPGQKFVIPPK